MIPQIPFILRRLFNPNLKNTPLEQHEQGYEYQSSGHPFNDEVSSVNLDSCEKHRKPIHTFSVHKRALIFFLSPDENTVAFPSASPPSKEEIEERGEFFIAQDARNNGLQYEFDLFWDRIVHDEAKRDHLLQRTTWFVNWVIESLTCFSYTASKKREACTVLFDFVEVLFTVADLLDLLYLDWDIHNENEQLCALESSDEDVSSCILSLESTVLQKSFTSTLLKAVTLMTCYGSSREAYRSLTGLFHNPRIGLIGRLIVLPVFGKVLNEFLSKQASFLMSVNTTIHARVLTEQHFIEEANRSLRESQNYAPSKHTTDPSQRQPVPFYLQWLVGSSLYIIRYFLVLGESRVRKQATDLHGVGPSSCYALLSKVLTFFATAFHLNYPQTAYQALQVQEESTSVERQMGLQFAPFGSRASTHPVVQAWGKVFERKAMWCLWTITSWFASTSKHTDTRFCFENTSTITPLNDGAGELELTPLNMAIGAIISCAQHTAPFYADKQKILPVILSHKRLLHIGSTNAYVLLVAGTTMLPNRSDLRLLTCLQVCFMCDPSCQQLFSFRQQRVLHFGLWLFSWTSTAPHALPSAPAEVFSTIHGLSLRPHCLLRSVLVGLAHIDNCHTSHISQAFLSYCIEWLNKYDFSLGLQILVQLLGESKTLTFVPPIMGAYQVAVVHLLKMQLGHAVTAKPLFSPDADDILNVLERFSRVALQEENLRTFEQHYQDALVLEILNSFKLLLTCPAYQAVANKIRNVSSRNTGSVWHLETTLNGLSNRVDIEQYMHQSNPEKYVSFSQLIPYVLGEVRCLLKQP